MANHIIMQNSFDIIVPRQGTGAISTDTLKEKYGRSDILPMWIADMDFQTPDFVRAALERRLDHQIYGYSVPKESYWQSILDWEKKTNHWNIERNHLTFIPGIVRGIGFVINCFTAPGDCVVVQPPVYMPFLSLPRDNGRKILYNPLLFDADNGTYAMDTYGLEAICSEHSPKLLILSNPHNPAGIVWPEETLRKVADICSRYGVLVISDEIHADMPLFGHVHHPFPTVSETAAHCSITFASPSKVFNIAGLVSSFAVVPDDAIRGKFFSFLEANELNSPLMISAIATEAAYTQGEAWREEMLSYVTSNIEFLCSYVEREMPLVKVVKPQASFLVWLDFTALGLDHESLLDFITNRARLALNDGEAFGPGGEGHMRLNVGCPRCKLEDGLGRLAAAYKELNK